MRSWLKEKSEGTTAWKLQQYYYNVLKGVIDELSQHFVAVVAKDLLDLEIVFLILVNQCVSHRLLVGSQHHIVHLIDLLLHVLKGFIVQRHGSAEKN